MSVLVTGASGFLGRHMAAYLRRTSAEKVFTLGRRPSSEPRYLKADLLEPAQIRSALLRAKPRAVFHLAGGTHLAWPELWRAHVLATYGLLEAVLSLPPGARPKIVLAGSVHEHAPKNPYGWSKLCQTQVALAYAPMGISTVVARISNIVGPGLPESHALSSFCRQAALIEAGRAEALLARGNLSAGRDFIDVRDVCRALSLLSRKGKAGAVVDVCSGRTTRLSGALKILQRLAGKPFLIRQEKTSAPADRLSFSPAGLKALTGWKPGTSLEESLGSLLAEWRGRIES
jgi:GDP-4-dehydro-6-deoxy-D-mannose reductase